MDYLFHTKYSKRRGLMYYHEKVKRIGGGKQKECVYADLKFVPKWKMKI